MAPMDIFKTWFSTDANDGCDVISRDYVVFVVLYICSFSIIRIGAILVDSKIWCTVAIYAYTFVCISSCLFVAHINDS
jgi:hypothetical protein